MAIPATTLGVATGTFLGGSLAALIALATLTALAGAALINWLPESLLQLVIGTLLLIFGLQWLRKAVLRSAGVFPLHDEEEILSRQQEAAHSAGREARAA